jgi:hypothetical protein
MNNKKKVNPKTVREYLVTVSVRAFANDGEAHQHPERGEDHALAQIITMEKLGIVSLAYVIEKTGQVLLMQMARQEWPMGKKAGPS